MRKTNIKEIRKKKSNCAGKMRKIRKNKKRKKKKQVLICFAVCAGIVQYETVDLKYILGEIELKKHASVFPI